MKHSYSYSVGDKRVTREVSYIPVRYLFAILITVFEVAAVIGVVLALCWYVPYFYLLAWATEIACVIRIIASDDNPEYKVPWLLFVLILPVAGFMLYFLFYSRKLQPKFIRRLKHLKGSAYTREDGPAMERLMAESPVAHGQAQLLTRIAESHVFTGVRQEYFSLGEEMHPRMLEDLQRAEKFIYLEFFIIEEGEFWDSILAILREKAAQGLDVRVLYDDVGCMMTLPGSYARTLRASGIQAAPFSRLRGNADSEFNNRSHRKLLIIDGQVGYTGGVNIADEYINTVQKFGHWKDVGLRLEGEAVWEMTRLFLIDYGLNVKKAPEIPADRFPPCPDFGDQGWVIPFGDGPRPMYPHRVGKSLLQSMLGSAQRLCWMTTPYLILDNDLCQSIENAALRGVDVRIIVPHVPDKKLILEMTRSFYPRLMAAGVRIYEYTPGFIHAKSYLVDDEYAMIGTINLDYRSLVHHFENGVWLYRSPVIPALKADLTDSLSRCTEITREDTRVSLLRRLIRAVVRIFAPML